MPVSNRATCIPGTQTQAVTVSRESLGPCGGHLNFTVEEVKTWSGVAQHYVASVKSDTGFNQFPNFFFLVGNLRVQTLRKELKN